MEQFFVSLDKLARESHLTVAYTPKDLDQFKVYTAEVYRRIAPSKKCFSISST